MEVSGIRSEEIRHQFLTLLLAQLRNQDPLSPVQQHEFVAQLAQFSSLEGIENLNEGFADLVALQQDALRQQQLSHGRELVGMKVTYSVPSSPTDPGYPEATERQGLVTAVGAEGDDVWLVVGQDRVKLEQVTSVAPPTGYAISPDAALAAAATTEDESSSRISQLLEQLQAIL